MNKTKYHSTKTTVAGIKFDSKAEAARYVVLMDQLRAGAIRDLKLQAEHTIQEAFTTPAGERVRAVRYKADFQYQRLTEAGVWEDVVEDVKGVRTKEYLLKRKLLLGRGVVIQEVP